MNEPSFAADAAPCSGKRRAALPAASSLDGYREAVNALDRGHEFFMQNHVVFNRLPDWIRQPENGRHWRLFRELFLSVAEQRVPVEFRPQHDDLRLRWRHHFRLWLGQATALVQRIRNMSKYIP